MYIVRDIFTAKPGMASKLAKLMKEVTAMPNSPRGRILTDLVGDYNTVVMESEFKDLASYEKMMQEYMSQPPDLRQKMAGYTDLWQSGRREVLRVVD
jgi:hypothetical protein